jgi:hypothetical protein
MAAQRRRTTGPYPLSIRGKGLFHVWLTIDETALAEMLGLKAAGNKSRKARFANGRVTAEARECKT